MSLLFEKIFRLKENNTKVRTEVLTGLTTFLAMAYIIFLQPSILLTYFTGDPTGIDRGAVLLVTGLASIFMERN